MSTTVKEGIELGIGVGSRCIFTYNGDSHEGTVTSIVDDEYKVGLCITDDSGNERFIEDYHDVKLLGNNLYYGRRLAEDALIKLLEDTEETIVGLQRQIVSENLKKDALVEYLEAHGISRLPF